VSGFLGLPPCFATDITILLAAGVHKKRLDGIASQKFLSNLEPPGEGRGLTASDTALPLLHGGTQVLARSVEAAISDRRRRSEIAATNYARN